MEIHTTSSRHFYIETITFFLFLFGCLYIQNYTFKLSGTFYPQVYEPSTIHGYVLRVPNDTVSEKKISEFHKAWKNSWPSFQISEIPSGVKKVFGHGRVQGFINALEQAITDQVDIAVILEDNALPFEDTVFPRDFEIVNSQWPTKSFMLLIGAKNIVAQSPMNLAQLHTRSAIPINHASGGHAWAIRKYHMKRLYYFLSDLLEKNPYSPLFPDISWFDFSADFPFYIASPLLVDTSSPSSSSDNSYVSDTDHLVGGNKWWRLPYQNLNYTNIILEFLLIFAFFAGVLLLVARFFTL